MYSSAQRYVKLGDVYFNKYNIDIDISGSMYAIYPMWFSFFHEKLSMGSGMLAFICFYRLQISMTPKNVRQIEHFLILVVNF